MCIGKGSHNWTILTVTPSCPPPWSHPTHFTTVLLPEHWCQHLAFWPRKPFQELKEANSKCSLFTVHHRHSSSSSDVSVLSKGKIQPESQLPQVTFILAELGSCNHNQARSLSALTNRLFSVRWEQCKSGKTQHCMNQIFARGRNTGLATEHEAIRKPLYKLRSQLCVIW